jgi:hypothetical protein
MGTLLGVVRKQQSLGKPLRRKADSGTVKTAPAVLQKTDYCSAFLPQSLQSRRYRRIDHRALPIETLHSAGSRRAYTATRIVHR